MIKLFKILIDCLPYACQLVAYDVDNRKHSNYLIVTNVS